MLPINMMDDDKLQTALLLDYPFVNIIYILALRKIIHLSDTLTDKFPKSAAANAIKWSAGA